MSAAALAAHQFRFDQKVFWRNPASVFFTVIFPVIFLVIFNLIFGNDDIEELGLNDLDLLRAGDHHPGRDVGATTQSLAINLTEDRERGLLKRVRGTPLPTAGLRRRAGRQLAGDLGPDGRPGRRHRARRLRRHPADRDDPGGSWSRWRWAPSPSPASASP